MLFKIIIDFIAMALIYHFVFYPKWKNDKLVIKTIFYIYFCGVIMVTLMPIISNLPFIFNHPYVGMSLIPFEDFIMQRGDFMLQIILNIIMMIPFGFLYPLIYKKKLSKTIITGFMITLGIEILQPLISGARSADITDIINNLIGTLIGYVIYRIFTNLFKNNKVY